MLKKALLSSTIGFFVLAGIAFAEGPATTLATNPSVTEGQLQKEAEREIKALRKELDARIKALRQEYHQKISIIKAAVKAKREALRAERKMEKRIEKKVEARKKKTGKTATTTAQ